MQNYVYFRTRGKGVNAHEMVSSSLSPSSSRVQQGRFPRVDITDYMTPFPRVNPPNWRTTPIKLRHGAIEGRCGRDRRQRREEGKNKNPNLEAQRSLARSHAHGDADAIRIDAHRAHATWFRNRRLSSEKVLQRRRPSRLFIYDIR